MGLIDERSIDIEQVSDDVSKARNTINEQYDIITNLSSSAGYGMQDSKNKIEKAIQDIKNRADFIDTKINTVEESTRSLLTNLKHAKASLNEAIHSEEITKRKVDQSKQAFDLRKTQTESLQSKYEGNFHSSWMGLWRPLTEEARVALFVVSIVFGIIALVCMFLIFSGAFEKIFPALSHFQNPLTTKRLLGGFYRAFIKKNK